MNVVLIIALFIVIVIAVIFCLFQKGETDFWMSMYKSTKKASDELLEINKNLIDEWKKTVELNDAIIKQSNDISKNAEDILASNQRLIKLLEAAKEINKEKLS